MKKYRMKYCVIIFSVLIGFLGFSQTKKIDSLKNQLTVSIKDTQRITVYVTLAHELLHENVTESFIYAFKGLSLSTKIKNDKGIADSYQILGNLHSFNSNDSALFYLTKSKDLKYKLKDLKGVASLYTNIGTCYDKFGNSDLALNNYIKSLKLFDSLGIPKGIAGSALGIGNVFTTIKDFKKAIEYYNVSIINYKKINSPYLSWAINNLATVYEKTNDRQKAKSLYEESLKLKIENNDFYGAVFSIDNIGLILHKEGKNQEALNYFFKALKINREHQFEKETFANSYKNIIESLLSINKNKEASLYLDSLWVITNKLNLSNLKLEYVKLKSAYYENIKDFKNALLYKDKYIVLNDSFLNYDMNKQVSEADAKYKTEKKQKEIELLNKDNIIQQIKIDKQQAQKSWFIIGLIILTTLLAYLYKSYLQKQKTNTLITSQKKEVENKNHIIEEKQKEIVDSIHYAKRIQTALLANKDLVDSNIAANFILFKPKDIVSGDFYWATEHNNKFYLAVCDCTGHGVPGAFMSLLSIGFLSEAVKEKNIEKPNEVFNYVRTRLIHSISNDGQQDGMDGILLCIDKITNQMTYAGANNEPILISDNNIIELQKNKMPVGKGEKTESFTLFTINANKGDTLYLYTDGYADQFGGTKGKKFKYKQLNELLLSINNKSMEYQKKELNSVIENWKGDLEQVDDILIIGLKI
jgi:serine phosphatase RsbU (regulator of sigma subunit)/Tfp pilus assembly protein PilF